MLNPEVMDSGLIVFETTAFGWLLACGELRGDTILANIPCLKFTIKEMMPPFV